jgi:hypothetical protein
MIEAAITTDELAWAQDCIRAGDTIDELVEWAGRTAEVWRRALGLREDGLSPVRLGRDITPRERFLVEAARAEVPFTEIGERLGVSQQRVRQLAVRMQNAGLLLPPRSSGTRERPKIADIEAAGLITHFAPEERRAA